MQKHDQRGMLDASVSFWSFGETMGSSWPEENKNLPTLGCFLKKILFFLEVARIKANA